MHVNTEPTALLAKSFIFENFPSEVATQHKPAAIYRVVYVLYGSQLKIAKVNPRKVS